MVKFNCKCDYCINDNFPNHSYYWTNINYSNGQVWIEIPKNGSGSIKHTIGKDRKKINVEDVSNFEKGFVVLREPLDRFKSLLAHYLLDGGTRLRFGQKWLEEINIITEVNDNTVCDIALENFDKIELIKEPHHFNSQTSFIPDEFYNLNKFEFVPMEALDKLCDRHQNSSPSNDVIITEKNENIIKDLYKEDFELYKSELLKKV